MKKPPFRIEKTPGEMPDPRLSYTLPKSQGKDVRDSFTSTSRAQDIKRFFLIECYKAFCLNAPPYKKNSKALRAKGEAVVAAVSGYMVAKFGIAESAATATAGGLLLTFGRVLGRTACAELESLVSEQERRIAALTAEKADTESHSLGSSIEIHGPKSTN